MVLLILNTALLIQQVIKKLHEKDRSCLIDAPCSGLGVLKEILMLNGN
jgi:16S rRNA C967 or C1407 C5-methylase (RsmB/RsmF family)